MTSAVLINPPTPPTPVGPTTRKATRPTTKIPQSLIDSARIAHKESFDPQKHLCFQHPDKVYTMKEIGLEGHGISSIAASEPFPLFTTEAIKQIRAEVFSEPVLRDCQYTSSFTKNMIRGMGRARAPFSYDAWTSPELLAYVSQVAGIDLTWCFDYEIGNINISVEDDEKQTSKDQDPTAFAWHYDSFPIVCVTMISDCEGMTGGETAMRMPSGEIKKIRGPTMGTAIILQGRYIEHQALKALGGRERTTMITPFRPKSHMFRDESVLTTCRAISNWSELYHGYTEYRLELLEERFRAKLKEERRREEAKRCFNVRGMRKFLMEQKAYLETTINELVEMEDID
ncbi:uncharacterized protein N7496_002491 [Penicillium cataractarum]|uniref:Fe2OG dioxygenase domain-containing protein n=1 Tax=Penicillium cataractarum TaxID=2100454 RepID=A0A9W9VFC2_9EURO|nr:uncharacterized protein N7496_002491 [Penicillium cataractarum]KAJ5380063.1 hypothetical protein N7496_002491 [Penicillium cataractarum]